MVGQYEDTYFEKEDVRPKVVDDFLLQLRERHASQINHFAIYGVVTGIVCFLLLKGTIYFWLSKLSLSATFLDWVLSFCGLLIFSAPLLVLYVFINRVVTGISGSLWEIELEFRRADEIADQLREERHG